MYRRSPAIRMDRRPSRFVSATFRRCSKLCDAKRDPAWNHFSPTKNHMKSYRKFIAAILAVCFVTAAAFAADASPAGTWKFTQPGRGGNPGTERTLKLDLKDGQLTGMLMG